MKKDELIEDLIDDEDVKREIYKFNDLDYNIGVLDKNEDGYYFGKAYDLKLKRELESLTNTKEGKSLVECHFPIYYYAKSKDKYKAMLMALMSMVKQRWADSRREGDILDKPRSTDDNAN